MLVVSLMDRWREALVRNKKRLLYSGLSDRMARFSDRNGGIVNYGNDFALVRDGF